MMYVADYLFYRAEVKRVHDLRLENTTEYLKTKQALLVDHWLEFTSRHYTFVKTANVKEAVDPRYFKNKS